MGVHPNASSGLSRAPALPHVVLRARGAVLQGSLVVKDPACGVVRERDRNVVASRVVLQVAPVAGRTRVSLAACPGVEAQLRAHAGTGVTDLYTRVGCVLFGIRSASGEECGTRLTGSYV